MPFHSAQGHPNLAYWSMSGWGMPSMWAGERVSSVGRLTGSCGSLEEVREGRKRKMGGREMKEAGTNGMWVNYQPTRAC